MDKRKNNGGHSTRTKGIDRRKNAYKDVLDDALTNEQLTSVVKMLFRKATNDEDTSAAKLLLEYYLGKPHQTIEQFNTHHLDDFNLKDALGFDKTE